MTSTAAALLACTAAARSECFDGLLSRKSKWGKRARLTRLRFQDLFSVVVFLSLSLRPTPQQLLFYIGIF
jgi:predicted Kef-type K+ transport protein